jgi:hypothetical protein
MVPAFVATLLPQPDRRAIKTRHIEIGTTCHSIESL